MTRREPRFAPLLGLAVALLGTVVLSIAGGSTAATKPPRDAIAPLPAPTLRGLLERARPASARSSATAASACDAGSGVVCSDVVVPLDRTGRVAGTITLHVETLPAEGAERGVMMLVAGGPGQGSAAVFDLGDKNSAELYHALFPGYRIVAFDNRGTGKSGLLICSALQQATAFAGQDALAAGCAAAIGPSRDFYSTKDHVDDTDAVRQALGVDKIGIWGTSYGTKLALAYALAYPTHVDRLLLDSVLPTDYPEPLEANVLHDMPLALTRYCGASACRAATPNFAADVAAVANTLARTPARGAVRLVNGSSRLERMDGLDMLGLVIDSDLNPGLAALLPAATHAARNGNTAALLRLHHLDLGGSYTAEELSAGLNAATSCADGHFPWDAAAPIADRPAKLGAAVASLPTGALGPFGRWATGLGTASFCLKWPSAASPPPPQSGGPYPDVPVLAVSGGYDMRTPTSSAAAVIRSFPHGRLLVVPAVGHSVVTADPSLCAIRAVRSWATDGPVPASCERPSFIVAPAGAYPPVARPARVASPRATLALAGRTIQEAEALWLMTTSGSSRPVAGLVAGKLIPGARTSFRLERYAIAPGVELSGRLDAAGSGFPLRFKGTLTVSGKNAAHGKLTLKRDVLTGTLGGTRVS